MNTDSTLVHHSDWSDNAASLWNWRISTKEFREDLEWAVNVPGDSEISPAIALLLDELLVRGSEKFLSAHGTSDELEP